MSDSKHVRVRSISALGLTLGLALAPASCGQGTTVVIVIPGESAGEDAGAPGPDASLPAAADSGPAVSPSTRDAASLRDADSGIPSMDADIRDAAAREASAPEASPPPDPAPFGCADAPFRSNGSVCLVHDPCLLGDDATYTASASLQCRSVPLAEQLTCASSSPYLKVPGAPVPPTSLLRITNTLLFPIRLRTPIVTSDAKACAKECEGIPTGATGVMRFELALPSRETVTVKVGAPWKVAFGLPAPFCVPPATSGTATCATADVQTTMITIFTTNYYAPARNVFLDVASTSPCP